MVHSVPEIMRELERQNASLPSNRSTHWTCVTIGRIIRRSAYQDLFGASVVEALYCNCMPLLPKRLVYPHIVPAGYDAPCFYEDFDDLLERLSEAVTNVEQTRRFSLRAEVAQYDWQVQGQVYDQVLLDRVHPA